MIWKRIKRQIILPRTNRSKNLNDISYIGKPNNLSSREIQERQEIAGKIKSSHFKLGENRNDYATTNNEIYKFNNILNKNALDNVTLDRIRGTHFKLGYSNNQPQTTHQSAYIPINNLSRVDNSENINKRSNINLKSNSKFEGKTIYMNDYTIKA